MRPNWLGPLLILLITILLMPLLVWAGPAQEGSSTAELSKAQGSITRRGED